jgi:hypothetical protein
MKLTPTTEWSFYMELILNGAAAGSETAEDEDEDEGPDLSFLVDATEAALHASEDLLTLEGVLNGETLPPALEAKINDLSPAAILFWLTLRNLRRANEIPLVKRSVRGPKGQPSREYVSMETRVNKILPILAKNGVQIPSHRALLQIAEFCSNRKAPGWARAMARGRYKLAAGPLKKGPKPKNPGEKKTVLTQEMIRKQLGFMD